MLAGMSSSIRWISYDCADPYPLSRFYAAVTGWPTDDEDQPDHDECAVLPPSPGHPGLLFTRVPEGKTVKNRLHLDLQPTDRTRDEEVERVVALGATVLDDRRRGDGKGWVVLTDPEGNEFCMNTSPAERGEPA
jgi:predicted enzyme related to lactoylglutathione lyase